MPLLIDELAGIVADGLAAADLTYPVTLIRHSAVEPDPSEPWEPVSVSTETFTCTGWEEDWSAYYVKNGLVQAGSKKICIVAPTLSVEPQLGDEVTLRGLTFTVVGPVRTDPARALWTLEAKQGSFGNALPPNALTLGDDTLMLGDDILTLGA